MLFVTFYNYGRYSGHYLVNAASKKEANKIVRGLNCYTGVKSYTVEQYNDMMDYPPDDNGLEDFIAEVPNDGDTVLVEAGT